MTIAVALILLWVCCSAAFTFGFVSGTLWNAPRHTSDTIDFTRPPIGEVWSGSTSSTCRALVHELGRASVDGSQLEELILRQP